MKLYIRRFGVFFNKIENIIESLNLFEKDVLISIKATEVPNSKFGLTKIYSNIEGLYNDVDFNKNFISQNYKKSELFNTNDYETFLDTPLKFFFLYEYGKTDLENPSFIIIETKNLDKKNTIKIYQINDNIKNFYDKLTSKTIEIIDGNVKYLYQTATNNEWELKSNNPNTYWLNIFRKKEFYDKLKKKIKKIKINIV